MIRRLLIHDNDPPAPCELCGAVDELRPYGPNGESICATCGEKDPETVNRIAALMGTVDVVEWESGAVVVFPPGTSKP